MYSQLLRSLKNIFLSQEHIDNKEFIGLLLSTKNYMFQRNSVFLKAYKSLFLKTKDNSIQDVISILIIIFMTKSNVAKLPDQQKNYL